MMDLLLQLKFPFIRRDGWVGSQGCSGGNSGLCWGRGIGRCGCCSRLRDQPGTGNVDDKHKGCKYKKTSVLGFHFILLLKLSTRGEHAQIIHINRRRKCQKVPGKLPKSVTCEGKSFIILNQTKYNRF